MRLPTRRPFSPDFPAVIIQRPDASPVHVRAHADYKAAKSGDVDAAFRLVSDVLDAAKVGEIRQLIGPRAPVTVAVHSEEAAGRNKIPQAYAEVLADRLGLAADDSIVHANRPGRTGSSQLHRIFARSIFDGPVEPGRDYLMVDDHISQGGTLADLRAYIESHAGRVIGATTLTGNEANAQLALEPAIRSRLHDGLPGLDAILKQEIGHGIDELTNSEAAYLGRYNSAKSIRDSILARRQATGRQTAQATDRGTKKRGGSESGGVKPQPEITSQAVASRKDG